MRLSLWCVKRKPSPRHGRMPPSWNLNLLWWFTIASAHGASPDQSWLSDWKLPVKKSVQVSWWAELNLAEKIHRSPRNTHWQPNFYWFIKYQFTLIVCFCTSVCRRIRHTIYLLSSFIMLLKGEFLFWHSMSSVWNQKNFVKPGIDMAQKPEIQKEPAGRPDRAKGSILRLEFGKDKKLWDWSAPAGQRILSTRHRAIEIR